MQRNNPMQKKYVCPIHHCELQLHIESEKCGIIEKGFFDNGKDNQYPIVNGIPNFIYPNKLEGLQQEQLNYYQAIADDYDKVQHLTFDIQNEDENEVRLKNISHLKLVPSATVLEIACGTGRDSRVIANQLDANGNLYVQDISSAMLTQCQKRLKNVSVPVNYSTGNAAYLSFPDNCFDAVYSFGGLNVFDDKKRSLKEMARVTKPGGRIVVGDESMPPWLFDTQFGKILLNNNKLFEIKLPLKEIPVEARDVCIRWIIGGVYYLIDFTVGIGEPTANFDMEIPGIRGGTLNSRYFGGLEGVSTKTKELAYQAAQKRGESMHNWLNNVVLKSAEEDLKVSQSSRNDNAQLD
jgi:ubiquinone/menaquinone biosynthesis C-methylase UbiE